MDTLKSSFRALGLMEDSPAMFTEDALGDCDIFYDASDSPLTSHFRLYDLPIELRLQIFETYVSTLYPRIVYRCFCHLCEPVSSTTLSAKPNVDFQRNLHRSKYLGSPHEKAAKFRRRFSYCEDMPLDPSLRTLDHGSGRDFDFPYGTGAMPAEPGIFVASKELRQNTTDAMVRKKPFHVFSQDTTRYWYKDRYWEIRYLPAWYREALRFGEELRPHTANVFGLTLGWSLKLPNLREVRLNHGRFKLNTSMLEEKLEWVQGAPRDRLERMVNRTVRDLMHKICIRPVQGYEQESQSLLGDQFRYVSRDWSMATLMKSAWERTWKVVVTVEFRVKVRENKRSKRQWASIVSHTPSHRCFLFD